MCRSRFKKKDNNEAEADLISLLQIVTAPEICSNTYSHPKQRRRFLSHMRYDRDKGEFVNHTVTKNNVMKVDIETDTKNFTKLGGKGQLKSLKLSGQEAVADTGASLNCCPTADINKYGLTENCPRCAAHKRCDYSMAVSHTEARRQLIYSQMQALNDPKWAT